MSEGSENFSNWNKIATNPYLNSTTDFHLTPSTDSSVTGGGIDGSVSGDNWGFDYDKDETTRTGNGSTGWSIGAYEYD
jgi:hypothetical protein